ncbi:hypothetical protein [Jannaschia sp. 2305UL9-9]|uniref:hypothetical protein n=1 Tax=Jannaschia sp. 2305UL9-9 TaxID=3121638 RepID=UPI0035280896
MHGTTFLRDETAAISVDWVVLTAAAVGMTLAVVTVMGDGLDHAVGDIDANLNAPSVIARVQAGFGHTAHDPVAYGALMRSVSQLDTADLDQMAAYSNALNEALDGDSDADTVGNVADLSSAVDIAYANAGTTRTTATAFDEEELTRISSDIGYEAPSIADG